MTGKSQNRGLGEVANRRKGQADLQHRLRRYLPLSTHETWRDIKLTLEDEQQKLNDCYFQQKDWRKCKKEVSHASHPADCRILSPFFCHSISSVTLFSSVTLLFCSPLLCLSTDCLLIVY